MKRVLLRVAVVLALVAVCIAGILAVIRGRSDARLERYKRDLRTKGEKLSVAELRPTGSSNSMIPNLRPLLQQMSRPPIIGGRAQMRPTNDWSQMRQLLDTNAHRLAEVRKAVALKPADLGINWSNWNTSLGADFITVRDAAHWLNSAVLIELERGRRLEALTNLLALLDLAHCHEKEGSFMFQMIRSAMSGLAFESTPDLLQNPRWQDADLARLQASWEEVSLSGPLEFSLQMERAVVLNYFQMIRRGTNIVDIIGMTPSLQDEMFDHLFLPVWRISLSAKDELFYLQRMQLVLDSLRTANRTSSGAEFARTLAKTNMSSPRLAAFRFPVASAGTPNFSSLPSRWIRRETERQLAIAGIGLERYRLRHGKYPEKLEELVPDILGRVPVDFGDGKPLRYKRVGEKYELWSVWENLRWPRTE